MIVMPGKTMQIVSFIDLLLTHTVARSVLCIVPINTIQNWLAEFNYWLPAQVGHLNIISLSVSSVFSVHSIFVLYQSESVLLNALSILHIRV